MKFYMSLLASSNNLGLISNLAIRCQYQSVSNMGKNVSLVLLALQKYLCQYCLKKEFIAALCIELINIIDGNFQCSKYYD